MHGRWITSCALGEGAGIAVVATVYAALDRGLLGSTAPWVLAAGAWEGLCLGGAQAAFLARYRIVPIRWMALTMSGALIGYGGSLLGGAGSGGGQESQPEPALWLIAMLGVGMGLGMGIVMGGLQWLAARRVLRAAHWIGANMIGWAFAMAIIMLAASLVTGSTPLAGIAAIGGLSGTLAGLALGAVTQMGLPRHQ